MHTAYLCGDSLVADVSKARGSTPFVLDELVNLLLRLHLFPVLAKLQLRRKDQCGRYKIDSEKQGQTSGIVHEERETQYFPWKGAL